MHVGEKTKQCANTFNCRFKVALTTAIVMTVLGIAAVFLFGR